MDNYYEKLAERLIMQMEKESMTRKETTEQFYRGVRSVIDALRERLGVAEDELPRDIAQEIMRLGR